MKIARLAMIAAVGCASVWFMACSSSSSSNAETAETTETEETVQAAELVPATAVEVSVAEFTDSTNLADYKEKPLMIDFWATWCGPCMQFKPVFHKVAEKYAGKVTFASVNVDQWPTITKQFGVQSIPQISIIMPDGSTAKQIGSMTEEQFTQLVENVLAGKLPAE